MNLFGLFSRVGGDAANRRRARGERLSQYARYLRSYQGYSVRGVVNTNLVRDWKRIKFNFIQPVVNISAGWFAAKPLDWDVDGDPAATTACYEIWDRSGSDCALLENAICCGIYGDIVGLATQDREGRAVIEFVDPSICDPTFDGSDYSRLAALEVAYEERLPNGDLAVRREMWGQRSVESFVGDRLVDIQSYDQLPAVWIRNSSVKGLPYGMSDVEPILDLVEEYDHVASKQTRIIDYYASPNVVFSGIQKGSAPPEKSVGTVYYLPTDAKAYFLEWSGGAPDVENQLARMRAAIAEVSQVPAVAYGTVDFGLNNIAGVALRILYGPLISKVHRKQANWGPALEYLMWLCLQASGYRVGREAVNVRFPNATPIDGQAALAESSARIAARLASRRTEMNNGGIEDPDGELLRIIIEEKMLQLATPELALQTDANSAARSGAKGRFAQELPAEVVGTGSAPADASVESVRLGETTDDDNESLIERFQALAALDAERSMRTGPDAYGQAGAGAVTSIGSSSLSGKGVRR